MRNFSCHVLKMSSSFLLLLLIFLGENNVFSTLALFNLTIVEKLRPPVGTVIANY